MALDSLPRLRKHKRRSSYKTTNILLQSYNLNTLRTLNQTLFKFNMNQLIEIQLQISTLFLFLTALLFVFPFSAIPITQANYGNGKFIGGITGGLIGGIVLIGIIACCYVRAEKRGE